MFLSHPHDLAKKFLVQTCYCLKLLSHCLVSTAGQKILFFKKLQLIRFLAYALSTSLQPSRYSVALTIMRELNNHLSRNSIFTQQVVKASTDRISEQSKIYRVKNA